MAAHQCIVNTRSTLPLTRQLLANNRLIDIYILDNIFLECTFLLAGGEEHPIYRKSLFKTDSTVTFISTCRTNIIISQL